MVYNAIEQDRLETSLSSQMFRGHNDLLAELKQGPSEKRESQMRAAVMITAFLYNPFESFHTPLMMAVTDAEKLRVLKDQLIAHTSRNRIDRHTLAEILTQNCELTLASTH